jgi:hypothetical protein
MLNIVSANNAVIRRFRINTNIFDQNNTGLDTPKAPSWTPYSVATGKGSTSYDMAANAAYKLLSELGGADPIGPVLLGMGKPVHVLQRGASVQDILNFSSRELELTYDEQDEKKVTEICYVDTRPKELR